MMNKEKMFCNKCGRKLEDFDTVPINTYLGVRIGDIVDGEYADVDQFDPNTGKGRVERIYQCPRFDETRSFWNFYKKQENGHRRNIEMELID